MQHTQIIETDARVFEARLRRGRRTGPDTWRWRLTVTLLSGSPLTQDEAAGVLKRVVAALVAQGLDVVWWEAREDGQDAACGTIHP